MKMNNIMPSRVWLTIVLAVFLVSLSLPLFAATHSAQSNITTVDTRESLSVDSVAFTPASVTAGQTITVSFRVKNLLNMASSATKAQIRVTTDGILSDGSPGLSPLEVTIPAIAANGTYNYSGTLTVPPALMPNNYFIGVKLVPNAGYTPIVSANCVAMSAKKLAVLGTGGPCLVVMPTARTVISESSTASFAVGNGGSGVLSWTATTTESSWLRFTDGSASVSGTGYRMCFIACSANTSTTSRTAKIRVTAAGATPSSLDITVTQAGAVAPPPTVTSFKFSNIVNAGMPISANALFYVTITAMNGDQRQTAFNDNVYLISAHGNVNRSTVTLVNGVWSGLLGADTASSGNYLTASTIHAQTSSEGRSQSFNVEDVGVNNTITIKVRDQRGNKVDGAEVSFESDFTMKQYGFTHESGDVSFSCFSAMNTVVKVTRDGFHPLQENVNLEGMSQSVTVIMRQPNCPVVILVPGIMGSNHDTHWDVLHINQKDRSAYPILYRKYPANRSSLKMFDPKGYVGWVNIKNLLITAGFEVFDAPWDWRMPVIGRPEDPKEKLAWHEYLMPVIQNATNNTGQSKVNIVAHSMGGLMARAYIQRSDYAGDIDKFAMVGTPNEGSAKAYCLWFEGNSTGWGEPYLEKELKAYEETLKVNYQEGQWKEDRVKKAWMDVTPDERRSFIQSEIKSVEELLPVYGVFLKYPNGTWETFADIENNPLKLLNQKSLDIFSSYITSKKVNTKLFYSKSESTIWNFLISQRYSVNYSPGSFSINALGSLNVNERVDGDGTVGTNSATLAASDGSSPFSLDGSEAEAHVFLVAKYSKKICDFLTGRLSTFTLATSSTIGESQGSEIPSQLQISIHGRNEPWIFNPQQDGAGIDPATHAYTNGWDRAEVDVGGSGSSFIIKEPALGLYQASLQSFPGEQVTVNAQFIRTNEASTAAANWIGSTNTIRFTIAVDASVSNSVQLLPLIDPPFNIVSFASNGSCILSWQAPQATNLANYIVYARQSDETLFKVFAMTTNTSFETGHEWATNSSNTHWLYTVVSSTADFSESPYPTTVENNQPIIARFIVDVAGGTPPLTVAFADQSLGNVTNWAWDFNGDGVTDATGPNPSATFAETGRHNVSLTVSGPEGEDTRTEFACVTVWQPTLSSLQLLPDWMIDITLAAQAGKNYELQASPDLVNWTTVTNLTATNATSIYRDNPAANPKQRFYRLIVP